MHFIKHLYKCKQQQSYHLLSVCLFLMCWTQRGAHYRFCFIESSHKPYELRNIIISILQVKKLSLRGQDICPRLTRGGNASYPVLSGSRVCILNPSLARGAWLPLCRMLPAVRSLHKVCHVHKVWAIVQACRYLQSVQIPQGGYMP